MVRDLAPGPAGQPVRDAILELGRRDGGRIPGRCGVRGLAQRARPSGCAPSRCSRRCCDDGVHGPLFAPYLSLAASVGLALEPLVDARTPFGIDVRRLATHALDDAAGHPEAWGDTHVFGPTHAFDLADADLEPPAVPAAPVSGDIDTRALHRLAARADRRGLPRLGRALRLGPGRPRRTAAGWCRWARRAIPARPTTSTSWRPGPTARLLPVELDWDRLTPEGEVSGSLNRR